MWAFSDESERVNRMLVGVVLVSPAVIDDARAELRGLLLAGQRRVHTAKESPRRRRLLLDTIARTDGLSAILVRHRRLPGVNRVVGRHLILDATTALVVEAGVTAWTLDDTHPAQRNRDRNTIGHALQRADVHTLVYDHRRSHTEPLLWAADAVCWAGGAGGDWRRRIDAILTMRDVP